MDAARLLILWGSQSGNAQDVAERLAREARLLLFSPRCLSMDTYDITQLPSERLVLMVTSTAGQGQVPDNMQRLWRFLLRKSLPPRSLAAMRYAVFGLGDSGYPQFNVAAKRLFRRLEGLGAAPLLPLGLGDDQHPSGFEAGLDAWLADLWPCVCEAAGSLPGGVPRPALDGSCMAQLGEPRFKVTFLAPPPATPAALQPSHDASPPQLLAADGEAGEARTGCQAPQDAAPDGRSPPLYPAAHSWPGAVAAGAALRQLAAAITGSGMHGQGPPGHAPAAASAAAAGPSDVAGPGAMLGATVAAAQPPPTSSAAVAAPAAVPSARSPGWAGVRANDRVTPGSHFQDTRLITLDVQGSGLSHQPGDVLAMLPQTATSAVDALLQRLGLHGSMLVRVAANDAAQPVNGTTPAARAAPGPAHEAPAARPCVDGLGAADGSAGSFVASVRDLVQGALDIAGASPRRFFFQVLQHFTPPGMQRERLAYFATAEGRDDLYRYNAREGRTVLEVLQDFPEAQPPLAWLLEVVPPLKPRYFSIASSARAHPGELQLLVALVAWTTPFKRKRQGLCSAYLAHAQPGDAVACWVEPGSMALPADWRVPLILVGPGTGVAPFRAMLEERQAYSQQQQQQQQQQSAALCQEEGGGVTVCAPCHLFFGCRSQHADFYFGAQWESLQQQGVLGPAPMGLVTAFSRDQDSKVYVTHRLEEHGADVWQLLEKGAVLYVAGSAKNMPSSVHSTITSIVQQHGCMTPEQAAQFVRGMEAKGRYFVEAWS